LTEAAKELKRRTLNPSSWREREMKGDAHFPFIKYAKGNFVSGGLRFD
jgi:hypothetical protein